MTIENMRLKDINLERISMHFKDSSGYEKIEHEVEHFAARVGCTKVAE